MEHGKNNLLNEKEPNLHPTETHIRTSVKDNRYSLSSGYKEVKFKPNPQEWRSSVPDDHLQSTYIVDRDPSTNSLNPNAIPYNTIAREYNQASTSQPRTRLTSSNHQRNNLQHLHPQVSTPDEERSIDSWIDELTVNTLNIQPETQSCDVQMQMLIQQRLPTQTIPEFDGRADKWVAFISSFYDMVHRQPYLDSFQKRTYLVQHLSGEPHKAVRGYANDSRGYIDSLQRLKYMFGNPSVVAQATIKKLTSGPQLNDDVQQITDYYYSLSECVNTLKKMNYVADIHSTSVLRQTLRRLPDRYMLKWAEYSFKLRRREEPNLYHLERWLQDRVMAAKDPYLPAPKPPRATKYTHHIGRKDETNKKPICSFCGGSHKIYQCDTFKSNSPSEKLQQVKSNMMCFNCLQKGHAVRNCQSKRSCSVPQCNKRHHTWLHDALYTSPSIVDDSKSFLPKDRKQDFKQAPVVKPSPTDSKIISVTGSSQHVFLQIVPVRILNKHRQWVNTYALLDNASQCTLIKRSLCSKLGVKGYMETIRIGTFIDYEDIKVMTLDISISSQDQTFKADVKTVHSIDDTKFNMPSQDLPSGFAELKEWQFIKGLKISNVKTEQIEMLIGADVPRAQISSELKFGGHGLPHASKTPFGWALIGAFEGYSKPRVLTTAHLRVHNDASLDKLVKAFWETESFGTMLHETIPMSIQDRDATELLDRETEVRDGHYVVPMIWKPEVNLPNNFEQAKRRLNGISRRFRNDHDFFRMYQNNITTYLDKGYARQLTDAEIKGRTNKTWYLPHHGVIEPHKPGKIRTVFDAAAEVQGNSLNKNLFTGPDLLNSLIGILLRFRKHKVAVTADIEAMFHRVHLKEEDTEAVRFLWRDDPTSQSPPDHYKMLVHIFGATDSTCCSAYALRRAALDQRQDYTAEVIDTVLKSFYVDDLLKSVQTVEEGARTFLPLIELLDKRGFKVTKFNSNSAEFLENIPEDRRAKENVTLLRIDDKPTVSRALGVRWNLTKDCFYFHSVKPSDDHSKRGILKTTSTLYDPLGMLTPFTLKARLILQELWRAKYSWDEAINKDLDKKWIQWLEELSHISNIEIPRCLDINGYELQLHTFCDGSEKAFSAASYVRVNRGGGITCHLLMSKSRVAPLKKITLPRLELQGAVMAVRLHRTIIEEGEMAFSAIHFWTDSTLNLQYISNERKRFKVFVSNRVFEIRESSEPNQWHHIPGKDNPSDLGTRETSIHRLVTDPIWFKGPEILYKPEESWEATVVPEIDPDDCEIKKETINFNIKTGKPLIDFTRFSKWTRLTRTIAWVLVFLQPRKETATKKEGTMKKNPRTTKAESRNNQKRDLTQDEERRGLLVTLKLIQQEAFKEDYKDASTTDQQKRKTRGPLTKLDPFFDEQGVLRVGGRLKNSTLPFATKHQIILPGAHPAVKLLVRDYHERYKHTGKQHLLSLLRQEFWITRGRLVVNQVTRQCVTCQGHKSTPMEVKMADLPIDRIKMNTPAFFQTGVDFFGPIEVKILRSRIKRWGCIFTCLTTRAIHLEVAPSLSTDDFINVLERFINRRGNPDVIRSDCGTNFQGAANELKRELKLMDQLKIEQSMKRKSITWKFNPPNAPHMGGAWERLIRSVKTSLKVILSDQSVSDFTLITMFTEVEALVNSRPLTHLSDDVNDLEPLTPNHFLIGRASNNLQPCVIYDKETTFRKRWRQVQAITSQFWGRWQREYLPSLTPRNKWRTDIHDELKVGQLVLYLEHKTARGRWQLARIQQLHTSNDGRTRTATIRTNDGTYVRPTRKLAALELSNC